MADPHPFAERNKKMNKISKIIQLSFHILIIFVDIIFILMLDNPNMGVGKILVGFTACVMATIGSISMPAVQEWYKKEAKDIDTPENEEKRNSQKSDEISDETIMKVLNAIGYEEESWIPEVRRHLKETETEK